VEPQTIYDGRYTLYPDSSLFDNQAGTWVDPRRAPRGVYQHYYLCASEGAYRVSIHLLMLEVFIGPKPPGQEGRHLDGNRYNNHIDNLAWGTHQQNADDTCRYGRIGRNGHVWLNTDQRHRVVQLYRLGKSVADISAVFGTSDKPIYRILRRAGIPLRHNFGSKKKRV